MRMRFRLVPLLLVLALIAAACGGDDEGGETTTTTTGGGGETTTTTTTQATTTTGEMMGNQFVLASILPLSGDLSPFGPGMQNAVQLAVEEANAAGGVHGEEIVYIPLDSGTNEQVAQDSANDAIAQGAQAVVGAAGSGISLSIIDLLVQSGVVQVSPSNTSPQFTTYSDDGYYFRTVPSDALQGIYTAQMIDDDGIGSVGIIFRQDSYGQGLADAFKANYTGEVVAEEPYSPEAPDFNAEVTNVAAADPEAVLCICFPETGALIMRSGFEQGLLDVPWYFTDGMLDPTFPETAFPDDPTVLTGFKGTAPASPTGAEIDAFTAAYEAAYGEEFTLFAPQSYDAAWLLILAAEMGDAMGGSIRDNMAAASQGGEKCSGAACLALAAAGTDFDYVGASGEIDFDEVGDPGTGLFQIWQFTASGDTEQLTTLGG